MAPVETTANALPGTNDYASVHAPITPGPHTIIMYEPQTIGPGVSGHNSHGTY